MTSKLLQKHSKVALFLMLLILIIPLISGAEFDNIVSKPTTTFDGKDSRDIPLLSKYEPIKIENWFGIGDTLAEAYISEHTESCGIECSSNIQIKLYKNSPLIDEIRFYTINEDESKTLQGIRNYQFYIKTDESEIEVEDYKWTCEETGKLNLNGTAEVLCENKLIGTHTETKPLWESYNLGQEVKAGTYEVKLEGEKKPTREVDWQIKTNGVWTTDWATWTAGMVWCYQEFANVSTVCGGLDTGLYGSAGTWKAVPEDISQTYDGDWDTYGQAGASTTATLYINYSTPTTAISSSLWQIKVTSTGASTTNYTIPTECWNATKIRFSIVSNTASNSMNASCFTNAGGMKQIYYNTGGSSVEIYEEAMVWDMTEGYVSLNSPANNYISPSNSVDFNCSATVTGGATLTNMSLWTNGTGSWERNQTNNIIDYNLYYKMASVEEDINGVYNLTVFETGMTYGSANCLIGNCAYVNIDNNNYIAGNQYTNFTANGGYINFWINATDITDVNLLAYGSTLMYTNAGGTEVLYGSLNAPINPVGVWQMITVVSNGTHSFMYVNGTLYDTALNPSSEGDLYIGTKNTGNDADAYIGYIDEMSFGTDVLISQQVNTLYNGGAGLNQYTSSSTQIFTTPISQPTLWTCQACDSDGDCGFASENRTVKVDTNAPQVTIIKPTASMDYGKYGTNETLNWSITDTNFQSAWYNYNGTNISLVGAINSTQFNLTRTTAQNLTFFANDSVANLNTTFLSWTYKVFAIAESYPTSILEGSEGTFLINITSSSSSVVPYLVYDGTSYLGTAVKDGSNYYISKTIDIPTVTADSNKTFYWSMLLSDASFVNTTATNITVTNFAIDNCTANSNKIVTFLFRDEADNNLMTGETRNIETEIEIFSVDGLSISTYNTQWTNQSNVSVCINSTLVGEEYLYDMITTFSVDNYVVEYWYADKEDLNASLIPVTINLMDLLATDSTSFLFNYFDSSGLVVDNIIVHTWRKYVGEGIFREVERSKQNEDGDTIVHLVEEDVIYYFTITLNNNLLFTSETYTALCQAVPCSITLTEAGGSASFGTDFDLVDNGGYSVTSDSTTREVTLNFSTTTPSTFNLTVYKLDDEGNLIAVGSTQTTSLEDAITVLVPLASGNVTYFASVYQDGNFIKSYWINFSNNTRTYIGNSLSIFLAVLIILSLGLLAVSEGSGTIVFVLLGVFLTLILGLVNWEASGVGISILVYLIIAGALIIGGISRRNR